MLNFWLMLWTVILLYAGVSVYKFWCNVRRFRDNKIPLQQPWWLLGNMWKPLCRRKLFCETIKDIYDSSPNAKYVGFFDFSYPVVLIRDPELIKSIAVTNSAKFPDHKGFLNLKQDPLFGKNLFALTGSKWHSTRTMLSPAFTSSKMKLMFELMNDCAEKFATYMLDQSKIGKGDVELKDIFTRYTNDVIASCAYGIQIDSMRDQNNDFYKLGRRLDFDSILSVKFFAIRSFPVIAKIFNIRIVEDDIHNFFARAISETIRVRDEQNITRPDMLQLMMDARGTANELDIEEMTAQAFIFFFGGMDTTSTLMCFLGHEIASNPEVKNKLRAEVNEIWEKTKGKLTYDSLNDMKYLDAVINESLRMYPPVQFSDRLCESEFKLPPPLPGEKSFTLEPGDNIWFSTYALHHDPQYFPNPEKFDPERFYQKDVASNHMAYVPFGLGPRMCIGYRFVFQKVKIVLFHLLIRCNFEISSKTDIPIKLSKSSFSLLSEGGFWIKLEPRKDTNFDFQSDNKNEFLPT